LWLSTWAHALLASVSDVPSISLICPPVIADESGSLPAAAALALTLHHLTGGKTSQSCIKQQSRYYFASAHMLLPAAM